MFKAHDKIRCKYEETASTKADSQRLAREDFAFFLFLSLRVTQLVDDSHC